MYNYACKLHHYLYTSFSVMLVLLLIESVSNSGQDDECVVSGSTAILDSSLLFTCVGMDLLKDSHQNIIK